MWNKAPSDPNKLPWQIKAGKRVLWSITIKAHGIYPEANFVTVGSFEQLARDRMEPRFCIVKDKQNDGGGIYYASVTAYQDCPEPYSLKS